MKFLISSITKVIVEVVDVTYCRNYSGHLVTTLFCILSEPIPGFNSIKSLNKTKNHRTYVIKNADSYMKKLLNSEFAIEVRNNEYLAIKNRYGYNNVEAVIYDR